MKGLGLNGPVAVSGNRVLSWLTGATKKIRLLPIRISAASAIVGVMMLAGMSGNALAAPKLCDDGTRPPCRDTGEEGAGNRLSYPALLIPGTSIAPSFEVLEGELGFTYSYGCDLPESTPDEQWSYPNTSCVDSLAEPTVYYTAQECTDPGGKCEGYPVDRIYWQKEEDNDWSAQATAVDGLGTPWPITVRFLDWGDSIEVVNWNENSILRVETQPFADLSQDPLDELPPGDPQTQLGFQMWHVSGQGITEHWGVRVTEVSELQGLPYAYLSPYAIINAGTAKLYRSKLFREAADDAAYACPDGEGDEPPVYPVDYPFEGRVFTPGDGWSDSCNLAVLDYTVEQSVSGKFVHGYNFRMRDLTNPLPLAVCGDTTWQKTGWWRLTFVPNGEFSKMLFDADTITSAPIVPAAVPTDISLLAEEEEETEGTLYTPVVDTVNNLTYIDVCIVKKVKGGGKKTK